MILSKYYDDKYAFNKIKLMLIKYKAYIYERNIIDICFVFLIKKPSLY